MIYLWGKLIMENQSLSAPDITQLLRKVEDIAEQEYGGHYSILKFTTHFKGGFGTPNLDIDGREEVSKCPAFHTLPELLVAMIKDPKKHDFY